MEGPLLRRSNLLPDGHRARLEQTGHSYGVTESLGIAVLSRGHSYGVAGITGHRGAIERLLRSVALPSRNTTPVETARGCNSRSFHTPSALVDSGKPAPAGSKGFHQPARFSDQP